MLDIDQLFKEVEEANRAISAVEKSAEDFPNINKPINLELAGLDGMAGVSMLFSGGVDGVIEKVMTAVTTGDYSEITTLAQQLPAMFKAFGIGGNGNFNGLVNNTIIRTIKTSVDSRKMKKTKSLAMKFMIVASDLKKAKRQIHSKEAMKEYEQVVKSLLQVTKMVAKLYKNREKVLRSLKIGASALLSEATHEVLRLEEIC